MSSFISVLGRYCSMLLLTELKKHEALICNWMTDLHHQLHRSPLIVNLRVIFTLWAYRTGDVQQNFQVYSVVFIMCI